MPFFCIHCRSAIDPSYKACPFCGDPISDFLRRHFDAPVDGKYQILSRLGIGGMGEVYKALHVHLNALRVLKLMRPNGAADPSANERFLREARMATRIQHPNVASLFDFAAVDDGSWFMVWEHIEGINLHELIDSRGPLSPKYAAALSIQALMGLDAIHRAGIVHRDISPENLMITRDDEGNERVKIIDLGIAKQSGSEEAQTQTGMFVGKWKYCSPEHLGMMPEGERIDGRADLYSFGIVLYEMLTGVPPFQADTPHAYVMLHASERPKALREVNPDVTASPQLEQIIFKALEKDRRMRFANAREFAQAIEQVLPSLDDRAGAPPPLPLAMEATEEATKIVRPTPAQAEVATIVTKSVMGDVGHVTLDRVHPPATIEQRRPKARVGVVGVFMLLVVGGVAAWMLMRPPPPPWPLSPQAGRGEMKKQQQPALPAAHLGINAFPWATVTRIRNIDSGADVPMSESLVTPALRELAPGRYEITLSNPQFKDPIKQTVEIAAGEERTIEIHFADPSQAPLPSFGGAE